jgi:hypothetical protein
MSKYIYNKYPKHYRAIEEGKIEDDYSNHFLSHFGFYDQNRTEYSMTKYYKTPEDGI